MDLCSSDRATVATEASGVGTASSVPCSAPLFAWRRSRAAPPGVVRPARPRGSAGNSGPGRSAHGGSVSPSSSCPGHRRSVGVGVSPPVPERPGSGPGVLLLCRDGGLTP